MMKFDARTYSQFRPQYPAELADLLRSLCMTHLPSVPVRGLVDIGSGTGLSTAVFVGGGISENYFAVEPDSEMLQFARLDSRLASAVEFVQSSSESTSLRSASCDVVTIGSAFHWMRKDLTKTEIKRILRKPGLLFFFEYRFPLSSSNQDLNDWIHQKLKVEWEIPELRERGSLLQLLSVFHEDPDFLALGDYSVPMLAGLSSVEMAGLLQSQSRYLRFVDSMDATEKLRLDQEIEREIHLRMGGGRHEGFDFELKAAAFLLRESER